MRHNQNTLKGRQRHTIILSGLLIIMILVGASHTLQAASPGAPDRTLSGIVTKNPAGEGFIIRAANGFTYRVRARWGKPAAMNVGDRVRAFGQWTSGELHASNVRILRQGEAPAISPVSAPYHKIIGHIVNDPAGPIFVIRARDGFTYQIVAQQGQHFSVDMGDRIRAYGKWYDGMLWAGNVRLLDHRVPTSASLFPRPGRTVTGLVAEDLTGPEFVLRGPRGFTYRVRASTSEPFGLSAGDRVQVAGQWQNGFFHARRIHILRAGRPADIKRLATTSLRVTGTVTAMSLAGSEFIVRDARGFTYLAAALWDEPTQLNVGDRIAILGNWINGVLHASHVTFMGRSQRVYPPRSTISGVTLTGVVTQDLAGDDFLIRTGQGFTYIVRARQGQPQRLKAGDEVRVFGDWYAEVLHARNLRVLH